jgi:HAMP domain-containing protein
VLPEEPRPPQNSRTEAPAPAAPGPAPIDQATGAPVVQGDKPPAVDANVPSTLKPDTKPPETKKSEPQGDLVWDDKDPDKLPVSKKTGKTNVVRFKTYPMSDEVKQAQKEIGRIRENYNREMQAQMEDEG